MKLFTKNTFRNLALAVLGAAALSACGGAGSCVGCAPVTPAGDVTLKLTAPNQYPAGLSSPITAYLTMTNTSNVNATNLYYAIPDETNHTHVAITVVNGVTNPCVSIPAQTSCTFPVTIAANAQTGSFTVTATPNGNSSQSTVKKLWSSLKSDLGLQAGTLSLTANIGLTDVPANTNSGANGISFLYSSTIAASESGETLLSIVGVVNSATAGAFNTINLTDVNGTSLYFDPLSGNSGQGLTNLANGSVVSFLLHIPAGATSLQFYAQTMKDGTLVDQGTTSNTVNLGSATEGILVVQPTAFGLSAKNNYESQVITLSNIGNGNVTGLVIPTPTSPLEIVAGSNTCGATLTPANTLGSICSFIVKSTAPLGTSGQGSLTVSSANGLATANYTYAGKDPVAGITLTSGDNPNATFVSTTESPIFSSQATLTNTGDLSESNFVFNVPQYFTLTAGTTGTPCTLSGTTVTTILAKATSCTLTLTYNNATATSRTSANLLVDYNYNGIPAPQSSIGLTYQTVQVGGLLQVTSPLPLPYTFPSIIADNHESQIQVFVITNVGTGTAYNITNGGLQLQAPVNPVFTIVSSTPPSSQCATGKSSLVPGDSCLMTVRFGPIMSKSGLNTKSMVLNYQSSIASAPSRLSVPLQGTLIAPLSANPNIDTITFNPQQVAGSGSADSPFMLESSLAPTVVTITYKNTGAYAAESFSVDTTSLSGYTVQDNHCLDVTLNINSTCTVVLSLSTSTAGQKNLMVGALVRSWSDQVGQNSGVPSTYVGQWEVYVTIYATPSVTAVISSSNTGSPVISSANAESTIYVVYKFSGGYQVPSMSYGVNLASAGGGTPIMAVVGSPTCSLSSQQETCFIQLNAGGAAQNQVIGYTTTGSVTPSPATSGNFNVLGAGANLLITPYTTNDFGDIVKDNIESSIRIFKVENIGTLVATGLEFYDTPDDYDMYAVEIIAPVGTPTPLCDVSYHANPLQRPSLQANEFCYYAYKFGPAAPNVPLGTELNNSVVAYYSGLIPKTAQESMIGNVTAAPTKLVIFGSASNFDGNLGGFAGADAKCNADANKPSGAGTYKALLAGNNATVAGKTYYRTDKSTIIAVATGGDLVGFNPLMNSILPNIGTFPAAWTGISNGITPAQNCENWGEGGSDGDAGGMDLATNQWANAEPAGCDQLRYLYCVQQ